MVKLIALDLDRTTLTSDGHLSEANKRALSGAIKRGVHVCIASGRAFDTLPEEVLNVQGIEYAITRMVQVYTGLQIENVLSHIY